MTKRLLHLTGYHAKSKSLIHDFLSSGLEVQISPFLSGKPPPLGDEISQQQGGGLPDPSSGAQIFGFRDSFWTVLPIEIAVFRVQKPKIFWPPEAAENFALS